MAGTVFNVFVAIYRAVMVLWHANVVFLQVMRSVMQEAKQEATELVALLDDGPPTMDAITSVSLLQEGGSAVTPWQMLIVARASSFVLLLRLSKHRVLHLEVDEKFIAAKLEVIRTEMKLDIQHVSRLLQTPIGMHETQLVRYMPMKLPYLWKEVVERPVVPALPASSSVAGSAGTRRKKCVQLLTERALRRRLHMDEDIPPRRGVLMDATNIVQSGGRPVRMLTEDMSQTRSLRRKRALYTRSSGDFSFVRK